MAAILLEMLLDKVFKCVIKMILPTLRLDNVGKIIFKEIGAV